MNAPGQTAIHAMANHVCGAFFLGERAFRSGKLLPALAICMPSRETRCVATRFSSVLFLLLYAHCAAEIVTSRTDPVAKLLNQWHEEGTEAGLSAISYENRDGGHSALNTSLYPGLQIIKPENGQTGPASKVRQQPVIGNCSMASAPEQIGCLPRGVYYGEPGGSVFLFQQYVNNNLFIYPEHLDHDAGGNGVGGYGDLLPLNTPTLVISQGSSFSDQPFVQAFLSATAAFSPQTQRFLIENKILMPTLQSIFRQSNKMVTTPADYLTGKAHPVVFDGTQIDEEKMVRLAHSMQPDSVPPLALLEVKEETKLENGVNYFEPVGGKWNVELATTPVNIARVMRGNVTEYGMLVSVSRSRAPTPGRQVAVSYHLLQGDARFVHIDKQPDSALARIRVRRQPPVRGARGIRSHRIDIGIFATDGKTISAPAIISFYMPPNEMHFYDEKGRVSEIHYQTHNTDAGLPAEDKDPRWLLLMDALTREDMEPLLARLLEGAFTSEELDTIRKTRRDIHKRHIAAETLARDPAQKDAAEKLRAIVRDEIAAALQKALPGPKSRPCVLALLQALEKLLADPLLFVREQRAILALADKSPKSTAAADLRAEIRRLSLVSILQQGSDLDYKIVSNPKKLSQGEIYALRGLHLTVLSQILLAGAQERSPAPAWVPPNITTPKTWRDLLHYEGDTSAPSGWTRYHDTRSTEFDSRGRVIPTGKEKTPIAVSYLIGPDGQLTWKSAK